MQCLVKDGSQLVIHNDSALGQDQPNDDDTPDVRGNMNSVNTPGPPTPIRLHGDGGMSTIAEGDEEDDEDDDDGLVVETFYAELISECKLRLEYETTMMTREQDGREEEIQVPMHPIQMRPENTLLFMARSEEQVPLECDLPEQAILEPEDVYVAYETAESDDTDYAESDEIGRYVELCFTKDMSPVIFGRVSVQPHGS